MMQQLLARHHRIQQVVNKAAFAEIIDGRARTPSDHLAKYEDCRYELKIGKLHEKSTCSSYGADFNLSKQATGSNRIHDMCLCRLADQHVLDCKTPPEACSGDENVPSLWSLALHLLIDNRGGVFHFNTSTKEHSPTKTCANFISCPKHCSPFNSLDMPCHSDIEQLCVEPVSETELLSIKQPAIQGENINEEEKNKVDRLWNNISSPTIRCLWMEDVWSTRFGALPESLSHAMGELTVIVKVTDFLNRESPISCDSISKSVVFSDSVAKHLLGDLLELLDDRYSDKKHTPDQPLAYDSEPVHSMENCVPNETTSPPIPDSAFAENTRGQSTDDYPSSPSTKEDEVESIDALDISTASSAAREMMTDANSVSSIVVNEFSQEPFFYIPHLPLAAPQLQPKIPPSPPFYPPKFQLQGSGQYNSLSTPLRSFRTSEAASSRFYYSPFTPITLDNPAYLHQEVRSQIRPVGFPVATALSLYPTAIQLQQPYLSTMPTVQVPQTLYPVDRNLTANSANIQAEGSSTAMEYRVNSSSSRTYYPPLGIVQLRNAETVTPLVPEYHQSRIAVATNQNLPLQYQSSAVFQRTYVPLLPCRAIFIPTVGQYYPQNYQQQQNSQSHYIGKSSCYVDPSGQSQESDNVSEEATITDTSLPTSLKSYPNASTTPSTLSTTESPDTVERGCDKTTGKRQPSIKKRTFKTQQKILSYKKSLWKSVQNENKPRSLKLSDFLLADVSVTSAFTRKKHKKKISTSEDGDNNNNVKDIQKSQENSTSCGTDETSDFFGSRSMSDEHSSNEDFESDLATVPDKSMIALDVSTNCMEHDTVEEQSSISCNHHLASDTDLTKLHLMKFGKVVNENDCSMPKESLRNNFETSYSSDPFDGNEELV